MPLTPFPVEQFGSLNVLGDATEVGMSGAVDLLNVALDRPGRLRTRDGYTKFSTSAGSGGISYLVPMVGINNLTTTNPRIVSIGPTQVNQFVLSTGVRSNVTSVVGPLVNMTRPAVYGAAPGALGIDNIYIASDNDTSGLTLQSTSGDASGYALAGEPGKPQYVCAVPARGVGGLAPRLAQAGYFSTADAPSGAHAVNHSTVFFSEVTGGWTVGTNFVDLDPGDDERFTGMVAWNGSLYLLKNTKAYEFFNESTLGDGSPEFNWRRISLPDPVPRTSSPTAWQPTAVGPDGVYFLGTRGLWRIGGGGVQRVQTPIDPIFTGTASSSLAIGNPGQVRMEWAGSLLCIVYANGASAQRTLVWDTATDTWTIHSYAQTLGSLPVVAPFQGASLFFGGTDNNIYKISSSATDDNGTAISWAYQTGYSSAGGYFRQRIVSSGERKKHFKTDILGSGTVTHQLLTLNGRPNDVADPGAAVTLGTAPALARGSRRRGARGTHFAHKLSGSGAAVVSGLTYWLSEISLDT